STMRSEASSRSTMALIVGERCTPEEIRTCKFRESPRTRSSRCAEAGAARTKNTIRRATRCNHLWVSMWRWEQEGLQLASAGAPAQIVDFWPVLADFSFDRGER